MAERFCCGNCFHACGWISESDAGVDCYEGPLPAPVNEGDWCDRHKLSPVSINSEVRHDATRHP